MEFGRSCSVYDYGFTRVKVRVVQIIFNAIYRAYLVPITQIHANTKHLVLILHVPFCVHDWVD